LANFNLFAGKMYDLRGSYDDAFYLMGALVALSGLMLFTLPCIIKKQGDNIIIKQDLNNSTENEEEKKYLPIAQNENAEC
jgi:hypothetical protein